MNARNTIYFILCLVWCSACTKTIDNFEVKPVTTGLQNGDINDIYFLNENIGYAVGGVKHESGFILQTKDGGNTWQEMVYPQVYSNSDLPLIWLQAIDFYNENVGQAVGSGGKIARTEDGGKTWEYIINGTWENFYDIAMLSKEKTHIVNAGVYSKGGIFSSTTAWYNLNRKEYNYALKSIKFYDKNIGYATGYGIIQKTEDGGNTWQILDIKSDNFYDIAIVNKNLLYVCGWQGGIYKSTDAGKTWQNTHQRNQIFSARHHYENIDFINENKGVVCGYNGEILYTENGGETWARIETKTNTNFHSIYFLNENKILAGGSNGQMFRVTLP